MASLPIVAPSLIGTAGVQFFRDYSAFPAQNAVFRRGDFLQLVTTGTITNPNPNGSLAAVTPTVAPTLGTTTNATSPRQTLFAYYTYSGAASIESLPSAEFIISTPQGFNGTVTVPSAGAPAAATGFNLYVGLVQGGEWQQVAATALGSAATVPYLLTNSIGANRAANSSTSATNVLGLALDDFDVKYQSGLAQSFTNISPFGADSSGPPMGFYEQYQIKYVAIGNAQRFEMSLYQAYYPGLLQTTCGYTYSTTYNTFYADTSASNKILTIVDKVQGSTNPNYGDDAGQIGDTGARVIVQVNTPTALVAQ